MKSVKRLAAVAILALAGAPDVVPALAETPTSVSSPKGPIGPVRSSLFHTVFVKTSPNTFGLLYQPEIMGPDPHVAIVYASPKALFNFAPAAEMASRGYQVLLVKHYLADRRRVRQTSTDGLREASRGISYMRALPGVAHVVLMGDDDGGRMAALYAAAAAQGTAVCQRPELLYSCTKQHIADITGLAKPDAVIMLDPALGAFDTAIAVDPAFEGNARTKHDLDMYSANNGYDGKTGRGNYSADFTRRFYAAQSARNMQIIDTAASRLKLIEQGKGDFIDDEPFVMAGAFNSGNTANLHDADLELFVATRSPHTLLKADGSQSQVIIHSVRAPMGPKTAPMVAECCQMVGTTVRRFLDNDAIRTTPEFALTANNIVGVDWASSITSTPTNAEYVSEPALVLTTTCSQSVVPSEIVYDHLAANDKEYVAVEGAGHDFAPCSPAYGDTKKQTFDFVDQWLAKRGRF